MFYFLTCLVVFLATYTVNMIYIIFYHRGLAHGAIVLRPWLLRWVVLTGNWMTGLDPKAWACMHRRHHLYADTPQDPHSPRNVGLVPVLWAQLRSYEFTLISLAAGRKEYVAGVADLDFPISRLNLHGRWWLPYLAHAMLATTFAAASGCWLLAASYYVGLMSHPIAAWSVNALGHRVGYRRYETADESTNNLVVGWLVMGEGYQNNHHHNPGAVCFGRRWWELDLGYLLCRVMAAVGMIELATPPMVPAETPSEARVGVV